MPIVSAPVLIVACLLTAVVAALLGWTLARRAAHTVRPDFSASASASAASAGAGVQPPERATEPTDIGRLRQLLEVSTDGSWEWRPESNQWWFSDSMLALHGYRRDEFTFDGTSFLDLVHEEDRAHLLAQFDNKSGNHFAMEFRSRHKSGRYIWLLQRGEVIERNAAGRPTLIIGTTTNVDPLKKAQRLIADIAGHLSSVTGDVFFQRLVSVMASTLDVRCCMVMDCTPDHMRLNYLCMYIDGSVSIQRNVTLRNPLFRYTDEQNHLSVRLGKDIQSEEWAWLGFVPQFSAGMPLLDTTGERIGYLVLCHDQMLRNPAEVDSVVRIFAERAASELMRHRYEAELLDSHERYRAFVHSSRDAIWRVDIEPPVDCALDLQDQAVAILRNAVVVECNEPAAQLFGQTSAASMTRKPLRDLIDDSALDETVEALQRFITQGYQDTQMRKYQLATKDSVERWSTISMKGIVEHGKLLRFWGALRDITQLHQHLQKLQRQAEYDSLTGLPNRNLLFSTVSEAIEQRKIRRFALVLMDLDRFKEINDTLGHQYGDEILKQIAPRLEQRLLGRQALVARLGGDEFAVMIPEIDAHKLAEVAQQLVKVIREPYTVAGLQLTVGVSMGGVIYPNHGADASTLMRCADIAMYAAKQRSLGFMLYESSIDDHSPERLALLSELERAIDSGQLTLVYQPKVDLRDASCIGVEVLVRWQHPERGMVSPGMFIPLAETTELIHPLTKWVLATAVAQWRGWADLGILISIAVNISARNLLDDRLPQQIEELLERHDMDAEYLELEITESAFMADPQRALANIERIHAMGVVLSIDDFGTGYSSLSYLKRLPVNTLKIDLGFVRHMLENEQDATIVKTIIHLAHDLGLKVVAEGVESQEIFEALARESCDLAQGYHISRPVAAGDISDWLVRHAKVAHHG